MTISIVGQGVVGRKCGMTQIFTDQGEAIAVSVIEVEPNRITQIKTLEKEGYAAVQIAAGNLKKARRVTKPLAGHYAKANVEARRELHEFRINDAELANYEVGATIDLAIFKEGQLVDVCGDTRGKGFAGTVKRHHFRTQDATHGNSRAHRVPGSIGQNQSPGKVFKGKKMCGHMGNVQRTIQNLRIIKIDAARNLILVKGAIPGAPGASVVVSPAVKAQEEK
jgi:large subunit ribosomal protein L3